MELEEMCWAPELRVSARVVRRRLTTNPQSQFVIEDDGAVWGVIYSQRIADPAALRTVRFDTADRLHRADGPVAHVLSLNIDPSRQSFGYGDALLEHLLEWSGEAAGVAKAVGVTRCKDFKRHPGIGLAEYIQAKNSQGRCLDTVLRMHQLHGAEIRCLVPGYRPGDVVNGGNGVLVEYDLTTRLDRLRRLERDASVPSRENSPVPATAELTAEILAFLEELVGDASGAAEAQLSLVSPLFELGLDSASLLDLQDRIEGRYGVSLEPLFFFECNTGEKIVSFLEGVRGGEFPEGAGGSEPEPVAAALSEGAVATARETADGDVAIIGMACRLPGSGDGYGALWELLADGRSAVTTLPEGRWQWPDGIGPDTHPGIDRGGFVQDAACFEPGLFRISPNEARRMDPQQRWMLELGWAALEDAGYPASAVRGTSMGVFIGASGSDYQRVMDTRGLPVRAHSGLTTSMAIIANRVSYFFDLRGPSVQVDTACSSSLVAVHSAVRALRAGDCETALVGGVNVLCHPANSVAYHQAGMLSPDGLCKTFDASANGYVRSEGGAVVLLKPLAKALADGDHVHAVIKGTATNHGGQSGGLTVPSAAMQAGLIGAALADAGVEAGDLTYVEAHGTGTPLGDPIEVQGLTRAFAGSTTPCGLGSVKTNLGHLEAAAGITGLLKTVLSMRHRALPASLHQSELNPQIDLAGSPFSVVGRLTDWTPGDGRARLAGVSSFGSGGSNAHVVVAEHVAPAGDAARPVADAPFLVVLSAESDAQLVRQAELLLDHVRRERPDAAGLADLAYTSQTGRAALTERLALVAPDTASLSALLKRFLAGGGGDGIHRGRAGRGSGAPAAGREHGPLADAWVRGADVDWERLYENGPRPRRVPLPTHVFAKKRYWLDDEPGTAPAAEPVLPAHPLLGTPEPGDTPRYGTTLSGDDFFLRDHRVRGEKVLPAVAYLEMARAALVHARAADAAAPVRLDHVVWQRPLVVADHPRTAYTALTDEGEGRFGYEIGTGGPGGAVHSRGTGSLGGVREPAALDLASLKARMGTAKLGREECYDALRSAGLDYGDAHRTLREVRLGDGEMLAALALPEAPAGDRHAFVLHPAVLDGALQAVYAPQIQDARTGAAWSAALPFALDALEVHGPTPATAYAWIRTARGTTAEVRRWDLDLCDEHGGVFATLRGYSTRESATARADAPVTLFRPVWRDRPAPAGDVPAGDAPAARVVLACGFGARLAELRRLAPQTTFLEPPETAETDDAPAAVTAHAVELLHAVKGILLGRPTAPVLVQALVPADGEPYAYEALSGLLKSAHLENPALLGQVVAVPPGAPAEDLAEALAAGARTPGVQRIRRDGAHRQVLGWEPVGELPGARPVVWREGGVHLITGGAGGLGLILAEEIARRAPGAVLCLTGRAEPDAERRARLDALRETGARVEYHVLDAADADGTAALVTDLVRRHGALHGVVHGAGVLHDNFLVKKSAAEFARVLRPKLAGAVALDAATKDEDLDFFVLLSSVMGATGNVGQADYAVANAFLDGFARHRDCLVRTGERAGRSVAIGWPLWADGGMGADAATRDALRTRAGMVPMTTAAGIDAFHRALAAGEPHLVVGAGERARLQAYLEADTAAPQPAPAVAARPGATVLDDRALTARTVGFLKEALGRLTGLAAGEIEEDELLGAYGMDSILATELTAGLETTFGPLSKTLLFEYHTLAELGGYFTARHREALETLFGEATAATAVTEAAGVVEAAEAVETAVASGAPRTVDADVTARAGAADVTAAPRAEAAGPAAPLATPLDIAVIGLSGRYPEARDLDEYWANLRDGRDCVVEVPRDRWEWRDHYSEDRTAPGRHYSKWGGFIAEVDRFDPLFFNISPHEADYLDPQERLFLEHAWTALEDAGHTREQLRRLGGRVGVYAGVMWGQYQLLFAGGNGPRGNPNALGSSYASVANRVSFVMNLHGPSMTVDTMCSSSLTAIELACRDLRQGRTKLAFAGGVNVTVHPNKYLSLSAGQFISSKGHCESFGIGGDGYIPGEGVGVVLLKPLRDAERDGDHIYGVIKGSGVSHGGRTNGYTVPNPRAQEAAIGDALEEAGADPRAISYVEAHGTGTKLGDPIEIAGLSQAFRAAGGSADTQYCHLGSAKSNIGHCESAAGIAGLTKVLLQLRHGQIAPSLHSRTLNPNIDFSGTPFVVNQELRPWERPVVDGEVRPRLAGISSFGAGGSNAHLLVEEYVERRPGTAAPGQPLLFPLSAKDEERLRAYAARLLRFVRESAHGPDPVAPADLAYTLQTGREAMDARLAVVADSFAALADRLERYLAAEGEVSGLVHGSVRAGREALSLIPADELALTTDRLAGRGDLPRLAELWVRGASLDWQKLYGGADAPRRVSAPTYPFARDRHWVPESAASPTDGADRTPAAAARADVRFLAKRWLPAPLDGVAARRVSALVLHDAATAPLASALAGLCDEATLVEPGPDAAQRLAGRIERATALVDLTGITGAEPSGDTLALLQSVLGAKASRDIDLLYVTQGLEAFGRARTRADLAGAAGAGLYRMLQSEYGGLTSRHLDLDPAARSAADLAAVVRRELDGPGAESEICHRDGVRHAPVLDDLAPREGTGRADLAGDEVLLVTGGTRGLGLLCARHLVERRGVRRLVLTGREPLPPRHLWDDPEACAPAVRAKIRAVLDLEARGVEVRVLALPLDRAEEVAAAVRAIESTMGRIAGVIHAAGLVDTENPAFVRKPVAGIARVVSPKTEGTRNLLAALDAAALRFVVLFSSVSAALPALGAGQSDYAMGNAFLDYFAQAHAHALPITSVQWPSWRESGFGEVKNQAYTDTGLLSISDREGLDLLDQVLTSRYAPVVMPVHVDAARFDPAELLRPKRRTAARPGPTTAPAPAPLSSPAPAPAPALVTPAPQPGHDAGPSLMAFLRETFEAELKLKPGVLDERTSYADYGADSILLAQILQRIKQRLGVPLEPSTLLEHPTLHELAAWLLGAHGAEVAAGFAPAQPAAPVVHEAPAAPVVTGPAIAAPAVRPAAAEPVTRTAGPVAVIGMACRLPGAPDLDGYWDLLREGRSAIRAVPEERWGRATGFTAGLVDDVHGFDAGYFMLHAEDVRAMDPQALVLLEETLKAVHHAGYRFGELDGSNTGVYVGARGRVRAEADLVAGARNPIMTVGQNYLAANISQFFNWRGPAMVLDTACSSSLVAMKLATDALAAGSVDLAVVAGVSLLDGPGDHELFRRRGLLQDRGEFHVFDRRAAGVVLGEGCGVVVLKPLDQAERDGDTVYAVVEGIAVNNDGRTAGPATPNLQAQKQVMRDALRQADRAPGDVRYLEVNGSGSQLTDLLELKAVQAVYRDGEPAAAPLYLGSMKPNIGHPLCAEGIAAFIKVALMVHHQRLVPFRSGQEPMEHFSLDAANLVLPRRAADADLPYAALSSFADGGTNGHVVLGHRPAPAAVRGPVALPELTRTDVRTGARTALAARAARADDAGTHVWTRRVTAQDPVMDHHRVYGRRLLPGLAWIDLLYRCFAESGFAYDTLELRDLSIHRPLGVDADGVLDLRVEAVAQAEGGWRVEATGPDGERYVTAEVHRTTGTVAFTERVPAEPAPGARVTGLDEVYGAYRAREVAHSGPMKADGTVSVGAQDVWVRLAVAGGTGEELFHPTLIDGAAVGASGALAYAEGGDPQLFLPLHYRSFRASAAFGDACRARVRRSSVRHGGELLGFTLEFFDADGHQIGELADFSSKLVRHAGLIDPARREEAPAAPAVRPETAGTKTVRPASADALGAVVAAVIGEQLGVPADEVSTTTGYYEMGLDSAKLLQAAGRLEQALDTRLSPTLLFEHATVGALVEHLSASGTAVADRRDEPAPDPRERAAVQRPRDPGAAHAVRGTADSEDIAVVGIAGRYPKAADVGEFWENLKAGRDCVGEVPGDRWPREGHEDLSRWGGFIDGVDSFDASFFGVPADEAAQLDPQERQFLEVCWEAVEDAGYTPDSLAAARGGERRRAVGVYVGVMHRDYALLQEEAARQGQRVPQALNAATIAHRVSHFCDFHGPSLAVDTVCASSLNAVHLAVEALRRGECDAALAGGVNLSLHPAKYRTYGLLGLLAQEAPARSFGAGGDGYVSAEGVGAVLLKPLRRAVEDGDAVYAVIKGSAVGHSGRTPGFRVPSAAAQQAVVTDCLERAGVDPGSLGYVEAHGTGTEIGDLMEVEALERAFRARTDRTGFCALGSVKSAIGHAESAAGISALTKAVLQLHHRTLTPQVAAGRANPYLDLADSPFRLQTELARWEGEEGVPRRAGVSSFGATGANAHVVLEEAPAPHPAGPYEVPGGVLVPLSAKDADRLRAYARKLLGFLDAHDGLDLAALAHTLQSGRVALEERLVLRARTVAEVRDGLARFLAGDGGSAAGLWRGRVDPRPSGARLLDEEEVRAQLVGRWAARGDWRKIAELWLEGYAVDWSALHEVRPARLHLPTYPFAEERHWVSAEADTAPVAVPRPAVAAPALPELRPLPAGPQWRFPAEGEPVPHHDGAAGGLEERALGFLRGLLAERSGRDAREIAPGAGFLELGLDSLGIVRLTRELAGSVAPGFVPSALFAHPTVGELAAHLAAAHPAGIARLVPAGRPRTTPETAPQSEVLEVLERLGDGALDLDDAIALLDGERTQK
ncbi:SDR family NAD(P)-dependent oxidoreductase [Streptomyces sp. NPDC059070]|uniref:SDR family NAD(P)-dependent oxidoreductase n=1 Tax=Streptomyces sp. NPDC059070 TaxID=3346713 RepID=UPI00368267D5